MSFTRLQNRTMVASVIGLILALCIASTYLAQYVISIINDETCVFITPTVFGLTAIRWLFLVTLFFFINCLAIEHIVGPTGNTVSPYFRRDGWANGEKGVVTTKWLG